MDLTSVRKIFACKWRHAGACSDPRTRGAGHRELGHVSASRIGECDVSSQTAGFLDNCGVLDKPWGSPQCFLGLSGFSAALIVPNSWGLRQTVVVVGVGSVYTLSCGPWLRIPGWSRTGGRLPFNARVRGKSQGQLWTYWQLWASRLRALL